MAQGSKYRLPLAACRTFRKYISIVKTVAYKNPANRITCKNMPKTFFGVIYARKNHSKPYATADKHHHSLIKTIACI